MEMAYIGTKGTHLMATQNINPLMPQADGSLVRRYPGFGDITMTLQDGDSTYHSWQTTVKRRFGASTFQAPTPFPRLSETGMRAPDSLLTSSRLRGMISAGRKVPRTSIVRSGWLSPGFMTSRTGHTVLSARQCSITGQ